MLHLLTATGARPEAFALCVRWMQQQNYKGEVTWVIVDDGAVPVEAPRVKDWCVILVRPQPVWVPGKNTQHRNLDAGLSVIPDDARVVLIEDDDHYSPGWLMRCHRALAHNDLFGQATIRRYHIQSTRYMTNTRSDRSSLHSTAVKGDALLLLREIVRQKRKTSIDTDLWHEFTGVKKLSMETHVTAIKGLPGRPGVEHTHRNLVGQVDTRRRIFNAWLQKDAAAYRPWLPK